jgi:7-carboxy-7-deazaguanine synthase
VSKRIPVSEIYGPVVQGEGPLTGRPTVFLRLGGCDYRCSWCDSLYAVEAKHAKDWKKMTVGEIAASLIECSPTFDGPRPRVGHVTISGGNPAIHDMTELIHGYQHLFDFAVETQGSVHKDWLLDVQHLVVSPKPPSSGNVTPFGPGTPLMEIADAYRYKRDNDPPYHPEVFAFKVVVFGRNDYDYAREVHAAYPDVPMWLQVGTDVGKSTTVELLSNLDQLQYTILNDPAMFDVHASLQQHVVLHGHKRGI